MWYKDITTFEFEDIYGVKRLVKDIKPIAEYQKLTDYQYLIGEDFDEIISRKTFYGDNQESLAYAISELNSIKLFECKFDLSTGYIKLLQIPVV